MAYTTINKSTDYFNTKLYTGNFSTNAITGVGFAPDFVWIKERSSTSSHVLGTTVQGVNKRLQSDTTAAEGTLTNIFTSFDSDGFTNGADNGVNQNGETYASWNWKANGQGSSNTDGSIYTTYTSVNTTSGCSISQYTGTGSNATVGHGLGAIPKMIIVKKTSASQGWHVQHASLGATKELYLNTSDAASTGSTPWNNTTPTASVFSVGTSGGTNGSSATYIAYCFAEKQGFSKIGSYKGNGNVDGTFLYTGFSPAFVIIKRTNTSNNWIMFDNKRDPFNEAIRVLFPNQSTAEDSGTGANDIDFLSNGIKLREDNGELNGSGDSYIYIAFAEAPLVGTNNIPANAR